MKIEINTEGKTISINEPLTLKELETVKKWLGDEWELYSIVPAATVVIKEVHREGFMPWTPIGTPLPALPYLPNPDILPYRVWCSSDNKTFRIQE